ncbi:MAG: translocation/assembly module TamB domain-containing protein [Polyangiales bacterium]
MTRTTHTRRHEGPEFGRFLAWCALVLLSIVGIAAVALPFVFQSRAVRARIEAEVAKAVKSETGLDVKLRIDRALWPPGVLVRDIEVASTTPKKPFATIGEARVTLRPFSLLSGRVVLDTIEVVSPEADVELVDGKLANLPLKLKEHPPKTEEQSLEPPFRVIAVTSAKVHLKKIDAGVQSVEAELSGIDVDVDVSGEATPVYEARLHKILGSLHTAHLQESRLPLPSRFVHGLDKTHPFVPVRMFDDDAICGASISLRMTDAATARVLELEHFELDVRLDAGGQPGAPPSCATGAVPDDSIVTARVDSLTLELPKNDTGKKPKAPKLLAAKDGGRLRVRVPLRLPYRYLKIDPLDGWIALDLDATGTVDFGDPVSGALKSFATGHIEGHELRFSHYRFGSALTGDFKLDPGLVVSSKKLEVIYGGGVVDLTDVEARLAPNPAAKKNFPLKATVGIKDLPMPGLIRELGVSDGAHVRWDFKDANAKISGYLDPLQLDGELVAHTRNFELGQRAVEKPNPGHIIGLSPKTNGVADLGTHVSIRPDHLAFEQIHAAFGGSKLDGRVLLGFDDKLEVDAKSEQFDLADGSPLAAFAMGGVGRFDLKLRGSFGSFKGEGSASFGSFLFDQFALGDVESANYKFTSEALIEVDTLKAKRGESKYDVPSMRIDLGHHTGVVVDALTKSSNMSLEDLYAIFKLTGDPRWEDIKGHLGFDARAHFITGGDADPCKGGRLDIDLTGNVLALDLWGERYDGGNADVSLTWWDFDGGGLGMDLDVHGATLKKKGGGTIVASGGVRRGGLMNMKVTAAGVNLKSLAAMPPTKIPVDGSIDAVAEVGGTFDTMKIAADVWMTPIRIGDYTLDRSKLRVVREPLKGIEPSPGPDEKGCYPKGKLPAFDPAKWASDPLTGEFSLTGDMFGGAVKFQDMRLTDARKKVARGKLSIRNLDLGALSLVRFETAEESLGTENDKAQVVPIVGKASADLTLEKYPLDAWWNSAGKVENITIDVARGDLGIATVAPTPTLSFGADGVSLPKTTLSLRFGEIPTRVVFAAKVIRHEGDNKPPDLEASIDLPAVPLKRLEEFLPRFVERAEGIARAKLRVSGTLATPTWDGEVAIEKGAFAFKQISMPLIGVNGKIKIDPKRGITLENMKGELGGGTFEVTGGAGIKGTKLGDVDVKLSAKAVNFRYGEGLSTTFDADIRTTWSPGDPGFPADPARVEGVVEIDTFLYEKRMGASLLGTGVGGAKRTEVDVYDPTRDVATLDIEVKSKRGLRVRNNLVDATLGIGVGGLRVSGTNQRWGVLGDLIVQKGGVIKFRRHDFEITDGALRFEDDTKVDPNIDLSANTDFRRAASAGSTAEWRIKLHVYGTKDDLKFDLSSDPLLSQEDLIFLLTIGMTKAESAQIGANVAGGAGLDLLANVTGVNETLSQAIPVIDDIRFGTAYSLRTGRTEPQVTFGKRLSDALRASVTSGFGERREIQANIEWQITREFSVRGSYDNVNDVSSQSLGNLGVDLRYRLEFE